MVLYYNPCTNMFPSATHHRLHQSVTTSPVNYNFTPTSSSMSEQSNCYSIYNSNSNNSNNSVLLSGGQLGVSSSPISQYPSEIGGLPAMASDVQSMSGPPAWYPLPPSISSPSAPTAVRASASMVAGSPFDEWPAPNAGSPLSASSSCISGSPVSALPPCAYAMPMPGAYGQSIQVGAYHPHSSVHRADHHYADHLHHHFHAHPHPNSLIGAPNSESTSVHASPDSGLTASSDGGTESPNGQQNSSSGLNVTTIVKSENGANRPQPARSPYEWMKKPSYQNQLNPGNTTISKTRTKDKYRVVYSDHQRLELEKEFHYSRYITIRRKSELASMLGLSERQVKIWFQNRRAKERKQAKKRDELIRKDKDTHHVVHNHINLNTITNF